MRKLILIAMVAGMAISCKKNSPASEAHCVYSNHQFISCEKTSQEAGKKCMQLRDQGHTNTEAIKKSKCDEC